MNSEKGLKKREAKTKTENIGQLFLITPPPTPTGPFPLQLRTYGRRKVRRDMLKA